MNMVQSAVNWFKWHILCTHKCLYIVHIVVQLLHSLEARAHVPGVAPQRLSKCKSNTTAISISTFIHK